MINAVYTIKKYLPPGLKLIATADTIETRLIKEVMTNLYDAGQAYHDQKGCWSVTRVSDMINQGKTKV